MELAYVAVVPQNHKGVRHEVGDVLRDVIRPERMLTRGIIVAVPLSAVSEDDYPTIPEPVEAVEEEAPEAPEEGEEDDGEGEPEPYDFSQHNVAELKELAVEAGVEGAHGMKRDELIAALS